MENIWVIIGLSGQVVFALRFVVQWIHSERKRQSIIPISFWYLSLGGGAATLMYSIYIRDPVFMIGQAGGLLVYGRNLYLCYMVKNSNMK